MVVKERGRKLFKVETFEGVDLYVLGRPDTEHNDTKTPGAAASPDTAIRKVAGDGVGKLSFGGDK